MFCMQEAIHNTFRNNVSYDDLGGTISPSENPDSLLTDNIFYVRKGVPFVRKNMALVESLDNTEAVFITEDYELHFSSGMGTKIPYQVME